MSTFTQTQISKAVSTSKGIETVTNLLNGLQAEIDAKDNVNEANKEVVIAHKDLIEAMRSAIETRDEIIAAYDKEIAIMQKLLDIKS